MGIGEKYNEIYSKNREAYGNDVGAPDPIVADVLKFRSSGSVFELGTGQGRNALFLAKNGFSVTARDLSSVGIAALEQKASAQGLAIQAEVGDIRALSDEAYDLWVSTFVLQELETDEALKVLAHIQGHTTSGGLNVLSCFTDDGDFADLHKDDGNFYPNLKKLEDLYAGWNLLEFLDKNVMGLQLRADGTPMENRAVKIIAQKP